MRLAPCLFAILVAGLLLLASAGQLHAQSAKLFFAFFEELTVSRVGQVVIEEIAASSGTARSVLREIGLAAASDVEAAAKLKALSPDQLANAMLRSDTFANAFRTKFIANIDDYKNLTAAINTARAADPAISAAAAAKTTSPFLSLDALSGDLKFTKPYVVCTNPWCEIKVEKIPLPTKTDAVVGGTVACAAATGCRDQLNDWMKHITTQELLHATPTFAMVMPPQPKTIQWIKCEPDPHWCNLPTLEVDKIQVRGVYMIWYESSTAQAAHVVRIGQGDIAQQLAMERINPLTLSYTTKAPLRVTWAAASAQETDGIERFLIDKYKPYLLTATVGAVTPTEVNLP